MLFRSFDAAQAEAAIDAGARYLVSPGLSAEVVRCARGAGVPVLPGCADASWIMAALELGIRTVKFFPASALGGPSAIRALSAAFPRVRFVPTGGVSAGNLADYLAVPQVAACGGSWMVSRELVAAARWDEISRLCAHAGDPLLPAHRPGFYARCGRERGHGGYFPGRPHPGGLRPGPR